MTKSRSNRIGVGALGCRLGRACGICLLLVSASGEAFGQTPFRIEEATIEGIQNAIRNGTLTSTQVVNLYLARIKAYNGVCVDYTSDGPEAYLGTFTPIKNAGKIGYALMTLNLRPAQRKAWGFDDRKARSLTDTADTNPAMPDALEVAAQQDAHFKKTGQLVGPLHGMVLAVKDQYDTFDMRSTSGMDAAYANDRPPDDATFIKRLREAGAIILAKANQGEMASAMNRSSFGGVMCNPYDTTRNPGHSSGGSGSAVAANLVTCAIGEDTGGSILHPSRNNMVPAIVPTQELVSRDGMIGAGMVTRVGPLCRTVEDVARVLQIIAGYDPKDEMTAYTVGRMPAQPYQAYATETKLNGVRIGVVREYMNKELFNQADVESIDIAEKAVEDLRRLGATIVDPRPGGALFQSCVDQYGPLYRSAMFISQFPKLFPMEGGKPTADHIETLVDLWFTPDRVPDSLSIRGLGRVRTEGQNKYMLNRYLRERGDANIKTVEDLANKSTFFTDIREDTGYNDRKENLLETAADQTLAMMNFFADRYAYQTTVLQCMAQQNLDAFVSPAGNIPAYILGEPREPNLNGRGNSVWPILGTKGFPMMNVPSGFTENVWDRVRDASAPGGTRLVGPVPARIPVAVTFYARPFDEPVLFRIASAYELATKHRVPPEGFGPVPMPSNAQ